VKVGDLVRVRPEQVLVPNRAEHVSLGAQVKMLGIITSTLGAVKDIPERSSLRVRVHWVNGAWSKNCAYTLEVVKESGKKRKMWNDCE